MRQARRKTGVDRWTRSEEKENFWKMHVADWQKSGKSIRAFCRERNLVETSFYSWRRELLIRARERGEETSLICNALGPTVKDARGRRVPVQFRLLDQPSKRAKSQQITNPFVPMRIVSNSKPKDQKEDFVRHVKETSHVEIVLSNGTKVITDSMSLSAIAELIKKLEGSRC
jgi:hypothetical protein